MMLLMMMMMIMIMLMSGVTVVVLPVEKIATIDEQREAVVVTGGLWLGVAAE